MAKKTFAFFGLLAVLLLSVGMVSAYSNTQYNVSVKTTSELPNPVVPGTSYNITINITNNNGDTINLSWVDTATTSGITTVVPVNGTIADGLSAEYIVTYSIPSSFSGTVNHKVDLDIYNSTGKIAGFHPYSTAYSTIPTPTPTPTQSWCEEDFSGEKGKLEITNIYVTNYGQGDDDIWEYLDEIEIEITVENTDRYDSINDVIIEIEIRDENNNTYSKKDFNLNDDLEDVGRISKDGDEEIVVFTIDELPVDLEERDYRLYVRAYEEGNEDEQCVSKSDDFTDNDETYFEFEIESDRDSNIIVGRDLESIQVSCGDENVEVTFRVYNIGSDKEEKVLVNLYNSALGINEYRVIDNLNDGRSKDVTFFISIPEQVSKTLLSLDINTFYDYDHDEDEMNEFSYDEDGEDSSVILDIVYCAPPAPLVKASLDSVAEVDEELVVKTIITNNGDENEFKISISNFESWAEIVSVSPQTVTIKEDEFTEAIIVLNPKMSGTQSFTINTIIDGESYDQQVSVKINEKKGVFASLGLSDTMTYVIIAIIALIILIFLVLIAKLSRRPVKPQF